VVNLHSRYRLQIGFAEVSNAVPLADRHFGAVGFVVYGIHKLKNVDI